MESMIHQNLQEGQLIYMVYVGCLKEDIQCKKPMKACRNCTPANFEAKISTVVYTAEKKALIGTKYFVTREDAEIKKAALTKELAALIV